MKRLLYIRWTKFPDSSAMSARCLALAKLFQLAGWEVLVLSRGSDNQRKIKEHEGVPYLSVSGHYQPRWNRAIDLLVRIPLFAKKLLKEQHFDGVFIGMINKSFLRSLKSVNLSNTSLFYDAVEWYSPSQFKNGEKSRTYRRNCNWITKGITSKYKVISISRYFEDYFNSRNIKTVRIPAVLDVDSVLYKKKLLEDRTVILYAGTPGKKDHLREMIEACATLTEEERSKLEIKLIGVVKKDLVDQCGVSLETLNIAGRSIKCMGRMPHEEVLKELQQAHFTVLIRPEEERYAKAGFPTKVPESLATGTPVMCNLSSDLGMYLKDGENAIILQSRNVADVATGLRRALNLTNDDKQRMCVAARNTAEKYFDYKRYANQLNELIHS